MMQSRFLVLEKELTDFYLSVMLREINKEEIFELIQLLCWTYKNALGQNLISKQ